MCLCGSIRFRQSFLAAEEAEARAGNVVLAPVFFAQSERRRLTHEEIEAFHLLHRRKIDMADELLVVAPNGYVGESTTSEIEYGRQLGKPIRYWEDNAVGADYPMSTREHGGRKLSLREEAALLWVLSEFADSDSGIAESLHAQVTVAQVVGGAPTMLDLSVPAGVRRVSLPDGPLPVRAIGVDEAGRPTSEVMVWIADGCLSALEHAWYTDDPPGDFPRPRELQAGSGGCGQAAS